MASGIGSNPISVNQTPQYGDKTAIDNLKRATAPLPDGSVAPRTNGRSPGPSPDAQPTAIASNIPEDHRRLIEAAAQAAKTAYSFYERTQKPESGPWMRYYAAVAAARYAQLAKEAQVGTPFFNPQEL